MDKVHTKVVKEVPDLVKAYRLRGTMLSKLIKRNIGLDRRVEQLQRDNEQKAARIVELEERLREYEPSR